jgi:hypothetical protein
VEARSRDVRLPRLLAGAAAFVAILAAFLVPRFLEAGTLYFSTPHEQSGVALHVTYQVAGRLLWSEGVPLWNPWSGCGTPHLANLQSAVFFPLNALFLVLPPIVAAEALYVLRPLLAALCCYVLGRTLRLSRGASFLLALAYSLNAWELRLANHHNVTGDALLPLTAAVWYRLGETGERRWLLWGAVLAAAHVYVGMPESAVFAFGFAALLFLFAAFLGVGRTAWGGALRKLAALAAVLALGALLSAAQALPFLEYVSVAWSTHLGAVDFTARTSPPEAALAVAYPFLDPDTSVLDVSLSVGAVVLAFGLRGLAGKLRGGLNLFLGAMLLVGALKLYGFAPVHALGRLPLVDMLNFPLYLPPLLGLSAAMLAAIGFDDWWEGSREGRGTAWPWLALAPLLLLLWLPGRGVEQRWDASYLSTLLVLTTITLALGLSRARFRASRPAWVLGVTVLLVAAELRAHYRRIPSSVETFEQVYRDPLAGESEVGAYLEEWLGHERRFTVAGRRLANVALIWGPSLSFDYLDAIHVERYWTYKDASEGFWRFDPSHEFELGARLMDLAAVGAVVTYRGDAGQRPIALMQLIRDRGFQEWSGSEEPRFESYERPAGGHGEGFVSAVPFDSAVRRMRFAGFERVRFSYGVARAGGAGPLRFELGLRTRAGEERLLERELPADELAWRETSVVLPREIVQGALTFRVTTPGRVTGPADGARAGFGDVRLVRSGALDTSALELRLSAPPYEVFENTHALPRAYVVHDAVVAKHDDVPGLLLSPEFTPGRTVVLEQPPPRPLPTNAPGTSTARIVESGARRVVVEVDATDDGLLVLSDTYYPGWVARVDGEERPILPANLMFRAVPVVRGAQRVVFTYDPRSFRIGALVSILALVGLIGAGAAGRVRGAA